MLNSPVELAPNAANFTPEGPAPVMPDDQGKYPIPMPGVNKEVEYMLTT
jgi:hypothetical protein